jgi:hypothetical protein
MERQELYCHACEKYVQFNVPETDGNLIVICPNCKHEHCRVVKGGVITEDRWDSRNGGQTIYATGTISSGTSWTIIANSSGTDNYIAQSWLNSGTGTTYYATS